MVTLENYEEYMILYGDGELSEEEKKALLEFVRQHPELQEELNMYEATKLTPDTAQVFAGKEKLLKPEGGGRVIAFRQYRSYGIAAAVLLILLLFAARWMKTGQPAIQPIPIAQQPVSNTPSTKSVSQQPPINAPVIRQEESVSLARQGVHSNKKPAVRNTSSTPTELHRLTPVDYALETTVVRAEPADIHRLELPSATITEPLQPEPKNDLLAWLPDEKKEGFEALKENVDQKIEKVKNIKDNLKDTQFALRFGSKELVVINF